LGTQAAAEYVSRENSVKEIAHIEDRRSGTFRSLATDENSAAACPWRRGWLRCVCGRDRRIVSRNKNPAVEESSDVRMFTIQSLPQDAPNQPSERKVYQ
jgi:hypothetical protein